MIVNTPNGLMNINEHQLRAINVGIEVRADNMTIEQCYYPFLNEVSFYGWFGYHKPIEETVALWRIKLKQPA